MQCLHHGAVSCVIVHSSGEKTNLAGTMWLQSGQFRVDPWWKAVVLVKVSTMVARHTGDRCPFPRWRLSQGIGESCKQCSIEASNIMFSHLLAKGGAVLAGALFPQGNQEARSQGQTCQRCLQQLTCVLHADSVEELSLSHGVHSHNKWLRGHWSCLVVPPPVSHGYEGGCKVLLSLALLRPRLQVLWDITPAENKEGGDHKATPLQVHHAANVCEGVGWLKLEVGEAPGSPWSLPAAKRTDDFCPMAALSTDSRGEEPVM